MKRILFFGLTLLALVIMTFLASLTIVATAQTTTSGPTNALTKAALQVVDLAISGTWTFNDIMIVGDAGGGDYISFGDQVVKPACGGNIRAIYWGTDRVYVCNEGTESEIATGFSFKTFDPSLGDNVVADAIADTLNIVGSQGITVTGTGGTDTLTIKSLAFPSNTFHVCPSGCQYTLHCDAPYKTVGGDCVAGTAFKAIQDAGDWSLTNPYHVITGQGDYDEIVTIKDMTDISWYLPYGANIDPSDQLTAGVLNDGLGTLQIAPNGNTTKVVRINIFGGGTIWNQNRLADPNGGLHGKSGEAACQIGDEKKYTGVVADWDLITLGIKCIGSEWGTNIEGTGVDNDPNPPRFYTTPEFQSISGRIGMIIGGNIAGRMDHGLVKYDLAYCSADPNIEVACDTDWTLLPDSAGLTEPAALKTRVASTADPNDAAVFIFDGTVFEGHASIAGEIQAGDLAPAILLSNAFAGDIQFNGIRATVFTKSAIVPNSNCGYAAFCTSNMMNDDGEHLRISGQLGSIMLDPNGAAAINGHITLLLGGGGTGLGIAHIGPIVFDTFTNADPGEIADFWWEDTVFDTVYVSGLSTRQNDGVIREGASNIPGLDFPVPYYSSGATAIAASGGALPDFSGTVTLTPTDGTLYCSKVHLPNGSAVLDTGTIKVETLAAGKDAAICVYNSIGQVQYFEAEGVSVAATGLKSANNDGTWAMSPGSYWFCTGTDDAGAFVYEAYATSGLSIASEAGSLAGVVAAGSTCPATITPGDMSAITGNMPEVFITP